MEKNKRNKIIGLCLGILVVLIIVVSSTYAYWQITRTQENPNDIVAACLSLDLNDADAENTGINLDSAWPISDDEGKSLTGYTFTVTNNCDEEINYIVGLNRVEEETANYLLDSSVKLQLDDNSSFTYGDLSDVEYVDATNTEYTARASKQVSVETIGAKGTNTHTIRIWVSEDAPVTEQSKTFLGQVFITGGQGIEVPECFTIADNGTITNYNYECGTDVKVPAEINGIQVKEINATSFSDGNVQLYGASEKEVYYFTEKTGADEFINFVKNSVCEDPTTCTLDDIEAMGLKIITTEEEYNAIDWDSSALKGPYALYFNIETGEFENLGTKVTSLDLSEAIYLETIGLYTFKGDFDNEPKPIEGLSCVYDGDKGYDCIGVLETLILPENGMLSTIGESAFSGNQIKEIILPNNVVTIESHAFKNNHLSKIVIPSSVVSIGYEAFYNNNISVLTFEDTEDAPSQLTLIDEGVFASNQLTKVIIPSSVTEIGFNAFGNNSITEFIIKNTEGNITLNSIGVSNDYITYNPDYSE